MNSYKVHYRHMAGYDVYHAFPTKTEAEEFISVNALVHPLPRMWREYGTCPKCNSPEWDEESCGACKFDVRLPWTIDDNAVGVEVASSYGYSTYPYVVLIEADKFSHPHTSSALDPNEARKLAALLIAAADKAEKKNREN